MHRIGIAMSGGPNPAEIIDLVVLAERLGYESAGVAEGLAATSAPCLAACAMRTSRILGSGPRSYWIPGSFETSVCDHGGLTLARPALHIFWLISQLLYGTEYSWHNRRTGMNSGSSLEHIKVGARATARYTCFAVSHLWRQNPSHNVELCQAQRRAAIRQFSPPHRHR